MATLYRISVWLHVIAAAAWLGAMIFLSLVLIPTLRAAGDAELRRRVVRASATRMRALGWVALGLLVLTGIGNLAGRGFDLSDVGWRLWQGPFGHALVWKLSFVGVVLLLSAVHDFRIGPRAGSVDPESAEGRRLRATASWMGRINLLLGLAILWFAVLLVRGWP